MKNPQFDPDWQLIPSLSYRYEIDKRGNFRNAKTKRLLKPQLRGKTLYVFPSIKRVVKPCSIPSLLWECHGIIPKKNPSPKFQPVTISKDGVSKFFPSLNACCRFLADNIFYSFGTIRMFLRKRRHLIEGWHIRYYRPEMRIFRSVSQINNDNQLRRKPL